MGRRRKGEPPRYRLHKQSGQAVVSLPLGNGKYHDVLLGPHDTPESRAEYARILAEWEANGQTVRGGTSQSRGGLLVNEVILAYWDHAQAYYRKPTGEATSEADNIRLALRRLRALYGHTEAARFDGLALEAIREKMIADGLCRKRINGDADRIKRVFQWAASKNLVPVSVDQSLKTVKGLRAGRSKAKERPPVKPVPVQLVEATLPYLRPQPAAMVQLQLLTGMRPGEVCVMRGIDLEMNGPVWTFRPGIDQGEHGSHKTAWRGHDRAIALGPQAQAVLRPWLRTNLTEYLFQPRESRAAFDAGRKAKRKSKITPSQAKRQPIKKPKRKPGERYRDTSYDHAVMYGVRAMCREAHREEQVRVHAMPNGPDRDKAQIDLNERIHLQAKAMHWHPNQLRHTRATEIRKQFGIDAARAVLGHRTPNMTEVYAELDLGKAAQVMAKLG